MVPEPVSHPSDVEMRELRAISGDLICRAACVGYASSCFHGFRVAAIRAAGADARRVDLFVEHVGGVGVPFVADACVNPEPVYKALRLIWSNREVCIDR
jgi:hypothetical protein